MKAPPWWAYVFSFGLLGTIGWCLVGADAHDKPRAPAFLTVKLAEIDNSYIGRKVCTCGLVQSTSSAAINTVYVSASRDWRKDNKVVATVVCWWKNYGPHGNWRRPVDSQICVKGIYKSPTIEECSVVDNCPS